MQMITPARPITSDLREHRLASSGFTIIELAVVGVLLFILAALIVLTVNGVQAKNRNAARQTDIDTLHSQLEQYYARTNLYPTVADLNNVKWRATYIPELKTTSLDDPQWMPNGPCAHNGKPVLSAEPTTHCYSYQASAPDGSACNNAGKVCLRYTLTAKLEGGDNYVKASINQ